MAQIINVGDLDALDEVVDADAVDHDQMPDQKPVRPGPLPLYGDRSG